MNYCALLLTKLDILPHDTIVKLCGDVFTDHEVEDSKSILFDLCVLDTGRKIKRKGVEKKKNNLDDMLNLLHGLEPDDIPCFVARDLSKLPPVHYNHMDMSVILKELDSVKGDIAELKIAQMATLKVCRDQPRDTATATMQPGEERQDLPNTDAADRESCETVANNSIPCTGRAVNDSQETCSGQADTAPRTNDWEFGSCAKMTPLSSRSGRLVIPTTTRRRKRVN